jgi:WD40 repeat protein
VAAWVVLGVGLAAAAALAASGGWRGTAGGLPRIARTPERKTLPSPGKGDRQAEPDHLGKPLPLRGLARLGNLYLRHGSAVNAVAVAPNGQVASVARCVRIWDPAKGKEVRHFGGQGFFRAVTYSADGKRLATLGAPCQVWDPATGKEVCRLQGNPGAMLVSLAFAPDNKTLATCSSDQGLKFWSAATGKEVGPRLINQNRVRVFAFSPRGNLLATVPEVDVAARLAGTADYAIDLWDLGTQKLLRRLRGHTDLVGLLAFSPNGKILVSGSGAHDLTSRLWDVGTGKELRRLRMALGAKAVPPHILKFACFSPDNKSLATLTGKWLVLWEVATGRVLRRFQGMDDGLISQGPSLAFTPDGKTLITGGNPNATVRLWDVAKGTERLVNEGHHGTVGALAFAPDGKTLASAGTDRTVRLWKTGTGKLGSKLEHGGQPFQPHEGTRAVCFSREGKVLASGGEDRVVRLWDVATGKPLRTLTGHESCVKCVLFSPDGKSLLSGGKTIRQWDLKTGKQVRRLEAFPGQLPKRPFEIGWLLNLAYAADGKTFASTALVHTMAGNHGDIRIWDAATGKSVRTLEGSRNFVTEQLVFARGGKILASWGRDNVVRLWDSGTGKQLRTLPPARAKGMARNMPACLAFAPDGKTLAVGYWDGTARLYDPGTGKEGRWFGPHRGGVTSVTFSPDGRRLATGSSDTTVWVWDLTEQKK